MSTEALERKLDLLIALTRVGVRRELEAQGTEIRKDPVSSAILDKSREDISAGDLKKAVLRAARQSEPTVKRRIADLVALGALSRDGAGSRVTYRNTGLFDF